MRLNPAGLKNSPGFSFKFKNSQNNIKIKKKNGIKVKNGDKVKFKLGQ